MSCSYASSSPSSSSLPSAIASSSSAVCPRIRHLVSGTFNSPFLHLLSFDTLTRTLSLLSTLPGYGPHSFLAVGRTADADAGRLVDTVYATTWAQDRPELIAWRVKWQHQEVQTLEWLGNVPITATSSYVHVQPPPYLSLTTPSYGQTNIGPSKHLFSAGGPTGEVHNIDSATGVILDKSQEIVFLKGGEKDLPAADKSRRALRYGAHSVDVGPDNLAYFADVGRNSFLVYRYDPNASTPSPSSSSSRRPLGFLNEIASPAKHDGPRHVVPSYTGKYVFVVTEHTSFVDVFQLLSPSKATFKHTQRVSILPEGAATDQYRGDTVRLSPDGKSLFATTRGMTTSIKGLVKVWSLDEGAADGQVLTEKLSYTALNSGGKAHAIEFAPRYSQDASISDTVDWAVFTDDQEGYISVLQWDGHDLQDIARIQLPPLENGEAQGASQAVWLS